LLAQQDSYNQILLTFLNSNRYHLVSKANSFTLPQVQVHPGARGLGD
jgi:hypothetical protein